MQDYIYEKQLFFLLRNGCLVACLLNLRKHLRNKKMEEIQDKNESDKKSNF